MKMRRIAIGAALIGASAMVARRVAPKLHERLAAACERMFEQMPDSFPPKRMMLGIEDVRANTARTLEILEEREQAVRAEQLGDVPSTTAVGHAA